MRCVLGHVQPKGEENKGATRRYFFWSDFLPAYECIKLMEIHAHNCGAEGVIRVSEDDRSFALILPEDGSNHADMIQMWWKSFRKAVAALDTDERLALTREISVVSAMAVSSDSPTWLHDA